MLFCFFFIRLSLVRHNIVSSHSHDSHSQIIGKSFLGIHLFWRWGSLLVARQISDHKLKSEHQFYSPVWLKNQPQVLAMFSMKSISDHVYEPYIQY